MHNKERHPMLLDVIKDFHNMYVNYLSKINSKTVLCNLEGDSMYLRPNIFLGQDHYKLP